MTRTSLLAALIALAALLGLATAATAAPELRTRYVEVVLNGRYHGVYVLMEKLKLDGDRVAGPTEEDDGFLLEYTHNSKIDPGDRFFRTPVTRTPIIFEDPERGDMNAAEARAITRSVGAFERALYSRAQWDFDLSMGNPADVLPARAAPCATAGG